MRPPMQVPTSTSCCSSSNAFHVAVAKLQMNGQEQQGQAANDLIQAAGEVVERGAQEQGVGRRVDVTA